MSLAIDVLKDVRGLATDAVWGLMIQHNGRLRSSRWLPARLKNAFANRWAIKERSEIALTVAGRDLTSCFDIKASLYVCSDA